jgi:AhpD family alkylhydroperoxidase
MENYNDFVREISLKVSKLKKELPAVAENFDNLHDSANQDGALSYKTKELIAIAIAIADRCDPCIGLHAKVMSKLAITRAEFLEMLAVTIYMGGGPSLMYAAKALQAFDEFSKQ